MMSIQYTESVLQTLARHLGVQASELSLTDDLYRDWAFTPLSLVVVLLDLERGVALELPPEELTTVRTVADLINRFRARIHASDVAHAIPAARRTRATHQAPSGGDYDAS